MGEILAGGDTLGDASLRTAPTARLDQAQDGDQHSPAQMSTNCSTSLNMAERRPPKAT